MWEGAFRVLFALWGEEGRRAPSAEASHAICFSLIGGRGVALPLWEDREVFTGLSRRSVGRERARVRNPLAIQHKLWSCECRCGRYEYSAAHCTCKPSSETPRVEDFVTIKTVKVARLQKYEGATFDRAFEFDHDKDQTNQKQRPNKGGPAVGGC